MTEDFTKQTKQLIDSLKTICANYGLGNDGNEFKIITQAFLYKFLNDKFGYEFKCIKPDLAGGGKWEAEAAKLPEGEYGLLLARLPASSARLKPEHFLSFLFSHQNDDDFAKLFDDTLRTIASENNDIFAVQTSGGAKVALFDDNLSNYITDVPARNDFCRALINQLINFSFENIFQQKFDFFSTIFEYLLKDYNKDGGGKYAEYYTPHAVARVMAEILVDDEVSNVKCYDPAAGSGTLLMNLAHSIGEENCSIYSQDISQKSSGLLRLNLILNNLVHSIQNIVQGNTLVKPAHHTAASLTKFDYIVSNPPFKLDFSDDQPTLASSSYTDRFFAGVPNVPKKDKDKMAIYLLFIQHIVYSLASNGKAAVVVPTGFLTAQSSIERKIREYLVENKILRGVVNMPSNIFATTGTNVSILFIDKSNAQGNVVLVDASELGTKVKDGKNQKTLLSPDEESRIISTFKNHDRVDNFSVVISYEDVKENYSFSASQYFEEKTTYHKIAEDEFKGLLEKYLEDLDNLFLVKDAILNVAMTIFDYWFKQFDFPDEDGKPYRDGGGRMVWNELLKKEIPIGWHVAKLGSVLNTTLGGTPDTNNQEYWSDGDIAWLSSGEIDNFPIIRSNSFITKKGIKNSPAVLLPKGSIVISIVRYIRVSILGIEASTNQSVIGIKENIQLKRNYLYPFVKSQVPILMSKRTGAQQPHINKGEVDNVLIVIPAENVLTKYYEYTNSIYEAITENKLEYSDLASLRNRLLPMLMNGQVIVNTKVAAI